MNSCSYFSVPKPRSREPYCPECGPSCGRGAAQGGSDERLESERAERAAVVGHDRHDRQHPAGFGVDRAVLDHRVAEHSRVVGQRELDGIDRVEVVRCWLDVEPVLIRGPVVPATSQSPGPAGRGLKLAEVQLPDLVRPGRLLGKTRPSCARPACAAPADTGPARSDPGRAAAAAPWFRRRGGRRDGPSPRPWSLQAGCARACLSINSAAAPRAGCGHGPIVEARTPALVFADDLRLIGAVAISGDLDGHLAHIGGDRLGRRPVPQVPPAPPGRVGTVAT